MREDMEDLHANGANGQSVRERVRFVLVRPSAAENIGAVARVMANFGFRRLSIVAPDCNPQSESARRIAVHAQGVLADAAIHSTLLDAVGDCAFVVGTAARSAGIVRNAARLGFESAISTLVESAAAAEVAVVFGPERTGLVNAELACCHGLTSIRSSSEYPVLNLSHAAAIVACSLSAKLEASPLSEGSVHESATMAEFDRMAGLLEEAAKRIGFLRHDKSGQLMDGLRRILLRSAVSKTELRILIGLARQILWHCDRQSSTSSKLQDVSEAAAFEQDW